MGFRTAVHVHDRGVATALDIIEWIDQYPLQFQTIAGFPTDRRLIGKPHVIQPRIQAGTAARRRGRIVGQKQLGGVRPGMPPKSDRSTVFAK